MCLKNKGRYSIASYFKSYYQQGDCSALTTLISKAPTTVMIDGTNWRLYKSGVFGDCGTTLNHAVQLVGVVQKFATS